MRDFIRYGAILTAICVISGVSLAFVYSKSSVIIEERQAKEAMKAMAVVLPSATDFEPVPAIELSAASGEEKGIIEAYLGKAAGSTVGAIVKVEGAGYGGMITMLVGMDTQGVCQGMQVISQSETPGLGANVKEEPFYGQFAGKKGVLSITKEGGQIDGISGATISSRGAVAGVNKALRIAKALLGM